MFGSKIIDNSILVMVLWYVVCYFKLLFVIQLTQFIKKLELITSIFKKELALYYAEHGTFRKKMFKAHQSEEMTPVSLCIIPFKII